MRKLFILSLSLLTLTLATPTFAQEEQTYIKLLVPIPLPNCESLNKPPNNIVQCNGQLVVGVKDFASFTVALFQFGTILLSILLIGIMMLGGFMYLASAGIPGRAQKGIDYMKNAAFSLLVLIFSVVILTQINPALVDLQLTAEIDEVKEQASLQCPDSIDHGCGTTYDENKCVGTKCPLAKYCKKTEPEQANQQPIYNCEPRKKNEADCFQDAECWSNVCNEGKCIDDNVIGTACSDDAACKGFKCASSEDSPACAFGVDGSPCSSHDQCADGYKCLFESNVCFKPQKIPWSRCASQSDCPSGTTCKEPPYHVGDDADILVCMPSVLDYIDSCKSDNDCKTPDQKTSYCFDGPDDPESFCTPGTLGSPCSEKQDCDDNLVCSRYSFSISGVCTRGLWGSGCVTDEDCALGFKCSSKTGKNKFCNLGDWPIGK